jgi:hypothetical protein
MSQLLYHATLNSNLSSIFEHGLVPKFGPFTRAAHAKPCPLHADPRRIHVVNNHLDEGLLSALCYHVIQAIKAHLKFNDAFIVQNLEPGWLTARDLAAFGAMIEVEVPDEDVHYQEQRADDCTCLEDQDTYLIRPTPMKRFWPLAALFDVLNSPATVQRYREFLEVDSSGRRRMNDGMFLFEFRPDALATPCPKAEMILRPLRIQYPQRVTDLTLLRTG